MSPPFASGSQLLSLVPAEQQAPTRGNQQQDVTEGDASGSTDVLMIGRLFRAGGQLRRPKAECTLNPTYSVNGGNPRKRHTTTRGTRPHNANCFCRQHQELTRTNLDGCTEIAMSCPVMWPENRRISTGAHNPSGHATVQLVAASPLSVRAAAASAGVALNTTRTMIHDRRVD